MSSSNAPSSILIIGSGVFGLSTAYSLTQRPLYASTKITLLDRSTFPSPDGSSIDTSRIIRADYSDPAYASLASAAQDSWRQQSPTSLGGSGRYTESGLVLVANQNAQGEQYVRSSFQNVQSLHHSVGDTSGLTDLPNRHLIEEATKIGGGSGSFGYLNHRSGWADATSSMKYLHTLVESTNRVSFHTGEATSLIKSDSNVLGANLADGSTVHADLVILATGAWTSKLIDLRGRAQATGQVLAYLNITESEQEELGKMPVLLNMSTGLFIIPPRDRVLKVARHAYGYTNPISVPNPDNPQEMVEISLPRTSWDDSDLCIPKEGIEACRDALKEMIPSLSRHPFTSTRLCWYTDTPNGDFLITPHPSFPSLFLATGGSGHGFKFLPVIGDAIVDILSLHLTSPSINPSSPSSSSPSTYTEIGLKSTGWEKDGYMHTLRSKWAWPKDVVEVVVTEDGSRGGKSGMVLCEEMEK